MDHKTFIKYINKKLSNCLVRFAHINCYVFVDISKIIDSHDDIKYVGSIKNKHCYNVLSKKYTDKDHNISIRVSSNGFFLKYSDLLELYEVFCIFAKLYDIDIDETKYENTYLSTYMKYKIDVPINELRPILEQVGVVFKSQFRGSCTFKYNDASIYVFEKNDRIIASVKTVNISEFMLVRSILLSPFYMGPKFAGKN